MCLPATTCRGVDTTNGPVTFGGAQFAVGGYTIDGSALSTTAPHLFTVYGSGTYERDPDADRHSWNGRGGFRLHR